MNTARLSRNPALIWPALIGLVFVVGWYLYAQTAHFPLVWDDKIYIEDVGAQRGGNFLEQTLTSNFFASNDYYRPLVQSSILLQWRWYENAGVLHVTNVAIHILNSVLVMVLASLVAVRVGLARSRHFIAAFSALIYVAHPSLVESVAWVSGRFDLTVTLFVLLILVLERTWRSEGLIKLVFLGLLFLFATLSKEMAISLPLLMPLWMLFWRGGDKVSLREVLRPMFDSYAISIYAALICSGLIYLAIRWAALGFLYSGKEVLSGELIEPNLLQTFLLIMKSYGWYGLLSVWPSPYVSIVHPETLPLAISDHWAWLSLLALSVLLLVASRVWHRGYREMLLLFIALVALLPASNLLRLPVAENIIQDRFLTLPLTFLCILFAILITRLYCAFNISQKALLALVLIGWFAFLSLNARLIVPMWSSDLTLWSWAKNQYPDNYRVTVNAIASLLRVKNYQDCDKLTLEALGLKKTAEAYMNRGACLDGLHKFAEAEEAFMGALSGSISKSYYAIVLVNIADLQMKQNKPDDVLSLLTEAEKILPGYLRTYIVGARFLDKSQQFVAADSYYGRLREVLSGSEKLRLDSYLKRRKMCIETTGHACEEVVPDDKVVKENGHA